MSRAGDTILQRAPAGAKEPAPGEWQPPTAWERSVDTLANSCCPTCKRQSRISRKIHTIDADGVVKPSLVCAFQKSHGCGFHVWVTLAGFVEGENRPDPARDE